MLWIGDNVLFNLITFLGSSEVCTQPYLGAKAVIQRLWLAGRDLDCSC